MRLNDGRDLWSILIFICENYFRVRGSFFSKTSISPLFSFGNISLIRFSFSRSSVTVCFPDLISYKSILPLGRITAISGRRRDLTNPPVILLRLRLSHAFDPFGAVLKAFQAARALAI